MSAFYYNTLKIGLGFLANKRSSILRLQTYMCVPAFFPTQCFCTFSFLCKERYVFRGHACTMQLFMISNWMGLLWWQFCGFPFITGVCVFFFFEDISGINSHESTVYPAFPYHHLFNNL